MMEVHVCNGAGTMLRAFAIGDNAEVIVGRDDSCDIRIVAKSVSREHCAIEQRGEDIFVRDLGSSGGVFVSGNRVDSVRVENGMEIGVGPAVLKFHESAI